MPGFAGLAVIGMDAFAKGIAGGAGSHIGSKGSGAVIALLLGNDDSSGNDLQAVERRLSDLNTSMTALNRTAEKVAAEINTGFLKDRWQEEVKSIEDDLVNINDLYDDFSRVATGEVHALSTGAGGDGVHPEDRRLMGLIAKENAHHHSIEEALSRIHASVTGQFTNEGLLRLLHEQNLHELADGAAHVPGTAFLDYAENMFAIQYKALTMLLWSLMMEDKSDEAQRELDQFRTRMATQASLIEDLAMDFVLKDYRRELFGNQDPHWGGWTWTVWDAFQRPEKSLLTRRDEIAAGMRGEDMMTVRVILNFPERVNEQDVADARGNDTRIEIRAMAGTASGTTRDVYDAAKSLYSDAPSPLNLFEVHRSEDPWGQVMAAGVSWEYYDIPATSKKPGFVLTNGKLTVLRYDFRGYQLSANTQMYLKAGDRGFRGGGDPVPGMEFEWLFSFVNDQGRVLGTTTALKKHINPVPKSHDQRFRRGDGKGLCWVAWRCTN